MNNGMMSNDREPTVRDADEVTAACAALSRHIEDTAQKAEAAIFESIPIRAAPNSARRKPGKA